ncbi:hypothetical protein ABEF95_005684 [Exophiala dermatitidis]
MIPSGASSKMVLHTTSVIELDVLSCIYLPRGLKLLISSAIHSYPVLQSVLQQTMSSEQHKAERRSSITDKAKQRTSRACDRCRLKKAKCDGAVECENCRFSQTPCVYTARKGREARRYYLEMHEVMEEALHRLYWHCRNGSGLPGPNPAQFERNGSITTSSILESMGLTPPILDESNPQYPNGPATRLPERRSFAPAASTQSPKSNDISPGTMSIDGHPPSTLPPESPWQFPYSMPGQNHGYITSAMPMRVSVAPTGMVYSPDQMQPQTSAASLPVSHLGPEASVLACDGVPYMSHSERLPHANPFVGVDHNWPRPGPPFGRHSYSGI